MIRTSEDIMRACVIDFGGSYQLSIRCAPFEALYGRKCRSPVIWAEIGGSSLIGPELVQETTDKVVLVKERPKAARDHQKSYVDYGLHFGKKSKLAPRYVGSFGILERIGLVAYRLRLPEELSSVHDTFHVSNLKKCLADANLHVPLNEIKIDKTLHFVEEPVEIMDRGIRSLKRSKISLVKVRWNSKSGPEFTWEREDHMKFKYPRLFVDRAVESARLTVGIKSLLDVVRITAAHVCVNTAQLDLVLLMNFKENMLVFTTASTKLVLLVNISTARENMLNMDQDSAHMVAASKVSMLKPGEYEIWRMRIEQYIQMINYALWEVIENGATLPKTTIVEGVVTVMPITTTEEKA
ncbi:hypothetical protein Tco_0020288 [Tanacetum coccineum]